MPYAQAAPSVRQSCRCSLPPGPNTSTDTCTDVLDVRRRPRPDGVLLAGLRTPAAPQVAAHAGRAPLVPVLLGQPVLRLYLLAEHRDCPKVANMFENTRTVFTTRALRFVAWNRPYHIEHHVCPAVPFHQLPALHGLMKDQLQVTADGYAAFSARYLARRM